MNVIKMIEGELKNQDWDTIEKAKYIYNRSCELFTYDSRYYYADYHLKRELKYKKIDLENVEDNRVVCSSHAREVCLPLLELIGIKGEVLDEEAHGKVKVKLCQEDYIMDAAGNLDFMRVKIKRSTRGFYPLLRRDEYRDSTEMKRIDQKIHYIQEDYFDIEKEFIKNPTDGLKFSQIQSFLREHPTIQSENDVSKVIDYFATHLLTSTQAYRMQELFLQYSNDWDIKRLYTIEEPRKITIFLLSGDSNHYTFEEITETQAKQEIENHKVREKQRLLL